MALKLGELSAIVSVDDKKFNDGLDRSKSKFKGFADKLGPIGAAAGAAAGAAIASGLTQALELDDAVNRLERQLGDQELAGDLGDAAGEAWARGFGANAGEATQAAQAAMQGGLLPEDAGQQEIEDLTAQSLALADTWDLDVTQAARAAGQMMRTGMAGDGQEALDILTRGFQKSGDLAGDTLDTVSEYGTQFRDLGLDGQQAMGLISQGLEAGARDTDKVADAIKEFSIRAIDGSDTTREAFNAIGLDAEKMARKIAEGGPEATEAMDQTLDRLREMEDPVKRDAAAVGLFGAQAEDLGDALYELDPSEAVEALGETEGAAEDLADTAEESATKQLESFRRQAKKALADQLVQVIPHIKSVATWLGENKEIVVPLVAALGTFASIIGVIIGLYKVWTAVQLAFNIVAAANPITWIVLAVVALIAVIVIIATKTTWFQDIWSAAWGWIQDAAAATGRFFKETVWEDWILGAFNAIGDWIGKVVGWFQDLPGKIKSGFSGLMDIITAPFRSAFNAVSGFWNRTVGSLSWSVPDWVPQIGGNSISAPTLPRLAQGGIVPAVPGGMPVIAGEGGRREAIAPLAELETMIRGAVRGGDGDQPPPPEVRVYIGDRELTDIVRVEVDERGRERDRQLRRRTLAGTGATR